MKSFKEHQANYDYYDGFLDEESAAVDEIYSLSSLPYDRFEDAFDSLTKDQFRLLLDIYYEYQMSRNS